jgi:hypothetical protein
MTKAFEADDIVFIEEWESGHQFFTPDELTRKLNNAKQEAVDALGTDGKPLPSNVYNRAKGDAFEKAEKDIAKDYGVTEWDGIKDLIARIVTHEKDSGKGDLNEALRTKEEKIEDLRNRLKTALEEKDKEIADVQQRFDSQLVDMEINAAIDELPIDAEGETLVNQRDVLKTMFKTKHKLDRREDRTVVSDAQGNPMKNRLGDPVGIAEVLKDFAPKWVGLKSDPEGGRGGSSTDVKSQGFKSINNHDELLNYAEKHQIEPGTEKYYDLVQQVLAQNPSANLL